MEIPIQNIYYLLCYAWDKLEEGAVVDVGGLDTTELADLFAHVLIGGTNHLLRRGLDRGYLLCSDDMTTLRGKIDVTTTVKRSLLVRSRAHCHFDELSHNVLHNRILKSTLAHLARTRELDRKLAHRLRLLHRRMTDVDEIPLNRMAFRRVQLHRNNAYYDFLMNICELVSQNLLAEQHGGGYRFRDFLRDEGKMAMVFEAFVLNFYRREQQEFSVRGSESLKWDVLSHDDVSLAALPEMRMDIVLRSPDRTVIVDTKYYRRTLQSHYEREKVHSGNLYQLFAYLKNFEAQHGIRAEGMLLYPMVRSYPEFRYTIQGHVVRICTVNLAQSWQGIRRELLELPG